MRSTSQPALTVMRYRALWLQLSRLCRQMGSAYCTTYGVFILYLFMVLTITVYNTMASFINGMSASVTPILMQAFVAGFLLIVVCNAGNSVYKHVGDFFREELLTLRVSPIPADVQNEVAVFLQTMELVPPVITLGDCITVNRALLMTFGSLLVTYLVVLFQFRNPVTMKI